MNEKNRNLVVRIVTAGVLLPAVLALLALGGWWTAGLVAVAAGGCAFEYELITQGRLGPAEVLAVLGAALIPLAAATRPVGFTLVAAWILWVVFIAASVQALFAPDRDRAPTRTAHVVTGCLYAGLGLGPIAALRVGPGGLQWVISALVITWANDTCAYFAGRLFGRHKLHPAVSPNKTWEGFAGGAVGSVAGMFIARWVAFPALTSVDAGVTGLRDDGGLDCTGDRDLAAEQPGADEPAIHYLWQLEDRLRSAAHRSFSSTRISWGGGGTEGGKAWVGRT